jgi:hypothetical protein
MPADKKSKAVVPFILIITSVTFIYLLLELIFPRLLSFLPLKTHWYLDEGVRVLAQSSKKSVIPEQYIALVGDSYAAGKGDWFLTVNRNKRPAFHSAHIINSRTGKDVITFGANGAGSLRGLVAEPVSQYEFINSLSRFEIKPPQFIIVYFYEGNDLNNNLSDLRLRYEDAFDSDRIYDEDYFLGFIESTVLQKDPVFLKAQNNNMRDEYIFAKYFYELIRHLSRKDKSIAGIPVGSVNQVIIDGKKTSIPDELQSPALELTDDEVRLSVYVFEQSLLYLKRYFASSKIGVVYIPSPLSSYRLASPEVKIETYEGRDSVYRSDLVRRKSDEIASLIEKVARDNNIGFIDSREFIWRSSSRDIIHGPLDWWHFNKKGYTALAEAVIELIGSMGN